MTPEFLWKFLLIGYLITIAIEGPIVFFGLSRRHPAKHRLFAGIWLTACTYPIVVLVLTEIFRIGTPQGDYTTYLIVAETFAPAAECLLFWSLFGRAEPQHRRDFFRDMAAIVIANLASFGGGKLLEKMGLWQYLLA